MLELSAVIPQKGGEDLVFKEEVVSTDRLIELFGLQEVFDKKKKSIYFKLLDRFVSKNPLTGRESFSTGVNLPAEILGSFNGYNVHIRYYKTNYPKQVKGGGVMKNYEPKRVSKISGKVTPIDSIREKEIALFLYLHPKNASSPILGDGDIIYEYYNPDHEAQQKLDFEKAMSKIRNEIYNGDINTVRSNALGFADNKLIGLYNVSTLEETNLRSALINALNNHPKEFRAIWENAYKTSKYKPVIQSAFDTGVITQKNEGNVITCEWSHESFDPTKIGTQQITKVLPTEDVFRAIENLLIRNPEMYEHMLFSIKKKDAIDNSDEAGANKDITASLSKADKEFEKWKENTSVMQAKAEDLVKYAAANDLIDINRTEGKVYYLENGVIAGEPIAEISNMSDWKGEFTKILNKADNRKGKAAFKKAVFDKLKNL